MEAAGSFSPSDRPASIGGQPAFSQMLPLLRPATPDPELIAQDVRAIFASGILTNGPYVAELEARAAAYLGVKECVAVSSCTAGLMLVLLCSGVSGSVIIPSFTFVATANAAVWNSLNIVFSDIDERTLTLSPAAVRDARETNASAVLATHIFGTPCDVEGLAAVADEMKAKLFFDAAHALGSRRAGVPLGRFGEAEVFSLSPTKVLTAGEGGIIATNDEELAQRCRIGRDYGNIGSYDSLFAGLNARMSEIHAAIAMASFGELEARIERRNQLAHLYKGALGELPGLTFPDVAEGDTSTYKDFTILVDAENFGMDAPMLARALRAEGIETRRYYDPPVHRMTAFGSLNIGDDRLPVTVRAAPQVLTLPLWHGLSDDDALVVAESIARIHRFAPEVAAAVRRSD